MWDRQIEADLAPKIEEMTPHEKAEDWLKFLESQPKDTPGLPDEALSRETIYD